MVPPVCGIAHQHQDAGHQSQGKDFLSMLRDAKTNGDAPWEAHVQSPRRTEDGAQSSTAGRSETRAVNV